jgi:hypothetical protein
MSKSPLFLLRFFLYMFQVGPGDDRVEALELVEIIITSDSETVHTFLVHGLKAMQTDILKVESKIEK